jgi:hypothetical protein
LLAPLVTFSAQPDAKTGRLVAAVLGLVLMIVGVILTVTLIAAPVGIPLGLFGLLLMLRSIF